MVKEMERLLWKYLLYRKGKVQTLFAATEIPLYILLHLVFTRSGLKYETMELCGLQSYVQNFNRRLRNVFLPFQQSKISFHSLSHASAYLAALACSYTGLSKMLCGQESMNVGLLALVSVHQHSTVHKPLPSSLPLSVERSEQLLFSVNTAEVIKIYSTVLVPAFEPLLSPFDSIGLCNSKENAVWSHLYKEELLGRCYWLKEVIFISLPFQQCKQL